MEEGNPLINVDLTKPVTVLIEKISDAVGWCAEPYQIRRVAAAQKEAEIIKAEAEIEVTDLKRRAIQRFLEEECRKQENMERITQEAFPLLEEGAKPEDMDTDWIADFFDKCRIISDDEMRVLWAKVLAGEANSPGTYSKRTVNLLSLIEREEAQLFTTFCNFNWYFVNEFWPLVYDIQDSIYTANGISFGSLAHLDNMGLVNFDSSMNFMTRELPQALRVSYHGTIFNIEFSKEGRNQLLVGQVVLTLVGRQLARICSSHPLEDLGEYIIHKWLEQGLVVSSPYPLPEVSDSTV